MPGKFETLKSGDNALDRVQLNISKALDPVLAVALLNGRLVETQRVRDGGALVDIPIFLQGGATANNVEHGLGRAYRGFIVVGMGAPGALVWEDAAIGTPPVDPNPDRKLFVRLKSSAAVAVKLWVF